MLMMHARQGVKAKVGAADAHDAGSPGGSKPKVGAADAHDVVMRARQGVQGQSGPKWDS